MIPSPAHSSILAMVGALLLVAGSSRVAAEDALHSANEVLVQAGSFAMGSPLGEPGRMTDERPHPVHLTGDFHIATTEVPWSLWTRVRDWGRDHGYAELPDGFNGFSADEDEDHPVVGISWWAAVQWCNARSEMEGRTPVYYGSGDFAPHNAVRTTTREIRMNPRADGYRLPTEAEWEYACRANTTGAYPWPSITDAGPGDTADQVAWHAGNADKRTHVAGRKPANPWGIHDMPGNVWEWCWDRYATYPDGAVTDPTGPDLGPTRVLRGGSWSTPPHWTRSANRHALAPATVFYTIGFRTVRNGS